MVEDKVLLGAKRGGGRMTNDSPTTDRVETVYLWEGTSVEEFQAKLEEVGISLSPKAKEAVEAYVKACKAYSKAGKRFRKVHVELQKCLRKEEERINNE